MKTCKLNLILLLLLCSTAGMMAQSKKLSKTYKTNPDVSVNVDAQHTNIIVERWDRDEVQVEAYLEAETRNKEELNQLLKNWKLETSGNSSEVKINSGGGMVWSSAEMDLSSLEGPLSKLPEMMDPLMNDLVAPLLENISKNPLPPEFYENMGDLNFDYEAYREEGDKYMERWEKNIEKKFGKDFEKSMEEWAANFEKDSAIWKKNFEMKMEKWGEEFGASMEKWGESFGKDMEKWAENLEKEIEAKYGDHEGNVMIVRTGKESKSKKTIKLKVPSKAKLDLDVRHGEVKLSGRTTNLKADLAHSSFSAGQIDGKKTKVNVSYSPVKVKEWDYGVLNAAYVENCVIDNARSIKLSSNSSDVIIKRLGETGILSGNFGKLDIQELASNFTNLNITLENSDLKLSLPQSAFQFSYQGTQSKIDFPKSLKLKSSESYDTQSLTGYSGNKGAEASISIDASFSDVLLN